jgi:hypothetical protein
MLKIKSKDYLKDTIILQINKKKFKEKSLTFKTEKKINLTSKHTKTPTDVKSSKKKMKNSIT